MDKPIPEAVRVLVAELDEYLRGCPDPDKTTPKWMVRRPSRLLWQCRDTILALTAAQQQGQAVAWSVLRIGNYGAAYDPRGACRAFTYDHQPGNVDAGRLGNAAQSAATASAGDSIDRGLALLKALQEAGFGVFQIGAAQPMQQGGGEVCPHTNWDEGGGGYYCSKCEEFMKPYWDEANTAPPSYGKIG